MNPGTIHDSPRPQTYRSLQACRAIAAAMVVLFHLGVAVSHRDYFGIHAFFLPFSFGDAGVEFFFVLSGFIITLIHRKDFSRPDALGAYIRKRMVRIYPIYWIIFLAVYLSALAIPKFKESVPSDPMVVVKSLLLVPQDPAVVGGTGAPVIIVAWSLQYEIVFYIGIALAILSRPVGAIVAICVGLNCIVSRNTSTFPLTFFSSPRVLLFLAGAGVAYWSQSKASVRRPGMVAAIGLLLFAGCVAMDVSSKRANYPIDRSLVYGIVSCLIVLALVKWEDQGRVFGRAKWMQLLGDSSYVLYLIHYPIISVLCKIAIRSGLAGSLGRPLGAAVTYIATFLVCILAAILIHLWIEKPILRMLSKRPIEKLHG